MIYFECEWFLKENVNILDEHDLNMIFLKNGSCEVILLVVNEMCALTILKLYEMEIFEYVLVSGIHGHVSVGEGNVNENENENILFWNFLHVHSDDVLE